ncbi:MAG TPA: sialidase family protein, partial [Thermoanaerobaculia bacterium]|nr:sialidase family protein [Thermoanaerobaculia bacterium]
MRSTDRSMAAVDRVSGELLVAWYDRRDTPDLPRSRVYAARSSDGGATFTEPRTVTGEFSIETNWLARLLHRRRAPRELESRLQRRRR